MDGIHDLGGKQGFGRIDVRKRKCRSMHPGKRGCSASARAMQRAPDWNLDRFRFTRECIDPVDYLQRPYFDQWLQTYAALMIGSGVATIEELATRPFERGDRQSRRADGSAGRRLGQESMARFDRRPTAKRHGSPSTIACGPVPHGAPGHTRLPAYVRGRIGQITRHHGSHVLPDANARGVEKSEPLYTVAFAAAELWPEAASRSDRVFVDLWESYLELA